MNTKPISTGEQAASCYFRTSVEKPHRKALIQIDERCNLHCVHCFVSATTRGASMPLVEVENILWVTTASPSWSMWAECT